jgi:hypothetical protein
MYRSVSLPQAESNICLLLENWAVPGAVDGEANLPDIAAAQTLRHGGDVQTLPETGMPSGGPVCAIFRYASENSR